MLFAPRSAVALHRLLDTLPVFAGDERIRRSFTLVPGSEFGAEALAALDSAGARVVPWQQARGTAYDLTLAASPKGELHRLRGPLALLPHGAGFNKTVAGEGSDDSASGLDPAHLLRDGRALASLYALAHPSQVARLAALCPPAAQHAVVVGDPTLDRLLASRGRRESYRAALDTGDRRLIALTSTWGPQSLLARHPSLPAHLAAHLPLDSYQLALILHPNEHSAAGRHELRERLAPALASGMLLTRPYEEWAALLVAADAVITDHGSTALYAAALDRPLLAARDGGDELLPGSPMSQLLSSIPQLPDPTAFETALDSDSQSAIGRAVERALDGALTTHRPGATRALAEPAFAEQGRALHRLREELYAHLGLTPPGTPVEPRLLPPPRRPADHLTAFAVRAHMDDDHIRIDRHPAHVSTPAHHMAAEENAAAIRHTHSAALLFRRARAEPGTAAWTAAGWTAHALATYPGCRTAAAILSPTVCVLRRLDTPLLTARIEPHEDSGRVFRPDPSAALSALHARLSTTPTPPHTLNCTLGHRTYRIHLTPSTAAEASHEL